MDDFSTEIARYLALIRAGNRDAEVQLQNLLHTQLCKNLRSKEAKDAQLATPLSDLYRQAFPGDQLDPEGRIHFFTAAVVAARRSLETTARKQDLSKSLKLDKALARMQQLTARESLILKLRYHLGLTEAEIAGLLALPVRIVKRELQVAKAALHTLLQTEETQPQPDAAPPGPRWFLPVLTALAALFLLGLFSTELADTDAWWHLKTGEYIVHLHSLPYPDPFAYTTAMAKPLYAGEADTQRFNLTHEWLAQAAMYLIEAVGGLGAVVLWKALLLVVACTLAGFVARLRTGSWLWGIGAALAASSVAVFFAHDRPSILSYLFSIAFVAILENRRRLWLLPLLALIWANCHGGFFLGWLICGAYCLDALLRRAPDWKPMLGFSAAAVLISGINPNGFRVVTTLASYRQSPMTATLMEWSRPGLWGEPHAFFFLLYGAAAVLAISWRRVRISDWLLFLAFAGASLAAYRNLPLIGLLAPVLIVSYFPSWRTMPRVLPPLAQYAATAALAAGLVWGIVSGAFFQLRAAEWRFPAGAATFLHDHSIGAHLFNTYEDGGYLIWRGLHVFIDGRSLSENVFQDYRLIMGTPPNDPRRDATLARYGVDAIVLNAFEYNSGIIYPLAFALTEPAESDWKLVYDNPAAIVFLRNPPPGVPTLDKSRILDHLEAECTLHVTRDPEFSLCARTLGDLFLRLGDRERARRNLALYLDHPYDDDPRPRQEYLRLLQVR